MKSIKEIIGSTFYDVNLLTLSQDYFKMPYKWVRERMVGENGKSFTEEEKDTLRTALRDIANKLMEASDKI